MAVSSDLEFVGAMARARRRFALSSSRGALRLCVEDGGVGKGMASCVWPSGLRLAQFLAGGAGEADGEAQGKAALELGCGCGLVSRAAAALGMRVVATDREIPPALAGVAATEGVVTRCMDWTDAAAVREVACSGPFDYVLCSDVLYSKTLFLPLAKTLEEVLRASPDAVCLLCYQIRDPGQEACFLLQVLSTVGLEAIEVDLDGAASLGRASSPSDPDEERCTEQHVRFTRIFRVCAAAGAGQGPHELAPAAGMLL